jgi:hypothetical protein
MSSTNSPRPPRVFISYSHDSEPHKDKVLALANQLRSDGINVQIDRYLTVPEQGFPRWMEQQIRESDFVLIVCTPIYCRRFAGEEQPHRGLGARWEGAIITQHLYAQGANNTTFIPILIGEATTANIPTILASTSYYRPDTLAGYEDLLRRLTNQHATPPPPLGELRQFPTLSTPPLFTSGIRSLDVSIHRSADSSWPQVLRNIFGREHIDKPEVAPYVMVGLTPALPLARIPMDDQTDQVFYMLCVQLFGRPPFLMKLEDGIIHVPYRNEETRDDESEVHAFDEGSIGAAVSLYPPGSRGDRRTIHLIPLWKRIYHLLTCTALWPRQAVGYDGPLRCRIALGNIADTVAGGVHEHYDSIVPVGARNRLPGWAVEREWDRATNAHDIIEDALASLTRQLQYSGYQNIKAELRAIVTRP